jgi:hypothetical protein
MFVVFGQLPNLTPHFGSVNHLALTEMQRQAQTRGHRHVSKRFYGASGEYRGHFGGVLRYGDYNASTLGREFNYEAVHR